MALTVRANGNPITPAAVNDYHDLLTGVMTDQIVTFKTDVVLRAIGGAPGAPTVALAAGTTMNIGAFKYVVTFVDANGGETVAGTPSATVTTTTGNQNVAVSGIPTGPTGTVKRNLYRTLTGGSVYYLVNIINDNTTTTFTDTFSDAAISGNPTSPAHPSFGGTLTIKDSTGTVTATLYSDGALVASSLSVSGGAPTFAGLTVTGTLNANGALNINNGVSVYYTNLSGVYYATIFKALQATNGNYEGYVFQTWKNTALANALSIGDNNPGVSAANIDNAGNFTGGTVNGLTIGSNYIKSASVYLGFKNNGGGKLAEFNSSGQLILAAGNPSVSSNASTVGFGGTSVPFDTFDVSETYPTDAEYARGVVLCVGENHRLTRCTHDKCRAALVVSTGGALTIGGHFSDEENPDKTSVPMALVGRVLVDTNECIPEFAEDGQPTLVTSDGKGGVRAMRAGETGFALGYMLAADIDGKVGIVVRPIYCQA
jgi:hypothetical protein